jgi:hypothetical protein
MRDIVRGVTGTVWPGKECIIDSKCMLYMIEVFSSC